MTRAVAVVFAVAAAVTASACGKASTTGPPEIRLGIDPCDGCGMAIAEPRYAGAVLVDDGTGPRVLKFDDIGCLARWEAGAQGAVVRARWVHDRMSERWIDASTAAFAQVQGLTTPMGSGIAAFSNPRDAAALLAERGGELLSWDAILARSRGAGR